MAKSNEEKKIYLAEYYKKNKEIIKERSRARYQAKRDLILEQNKEYRKNNLSRKRKTNQRWRENNLEKARKSAREYNARNLDKHREIERKRRATKANNGFALYTEQEVFDLYGLICHICNEPIDLKAERRPGRKNWERGLHIDHLIPIAKGGTDSLENVRPAHGLCNIRKGVS